MHKRCEWQRKIRPTLIHVSGFGSDSGEVWERDDVVNEQTL